MVAMVKSEDDEKGSNQVLSSESRTINGRGERKSFGVRLSNFLSGQSAQNDSAAQEADADDESEGLDHVGPRPLTRKELLESNLDQEAKQQKLKEERLTTQEKHRKQAKEGVLATKRQTQPSPTFEQQSNGNFDYSSGGKNDNGSFSVAPKQPEHKRHGDDVVDDADGRKLYLYEPAKIVHGSKKKHRPSINEDSILEDKPSGVGMSTGEAAAAAATEAEGPHDKKLWMRNLDIPQWIVMAAPVALSAFLVGAGIYVMKTAITRKR